MIGLSRTCLDPISAAPRGPRKSAPMMLGAPRRRWRGVARSRVLRRARNAPGRSVRCIIRSEKCAGVWRGSQRGSLRPMHAWQVRNSVVEEMPAGAVGGGDDRFRGVPRLVLIRARDRESAIGADAEYRAALRLFRYPARPRPRSSQPTARRSTAVIRTGRVLRWILRSLADL